MSCNVIISVYACTVYIQNQTDPFKSVTKGQNKALTFTFLFVQWPKPKIGIHCVETTSNSSISKEIL